MRKTFTLLALATCCSGALAAGYAENKKGDLSDDGLDPTTVKFKAGKNTVSGNYGQQGGVVDRDYFTIKVKPGQQLAAVWLEPGTTIGLNVSFIGVQAGNQVTVAPVGGDPADLLGWTHYGEDDIGTDILPAIGAGPGAQGFVPPLGPGTYSFWVQETGACECQYKFRFVVNSTAD